MRAVFMRTMLAWGLAACLADPSLAQPVGKRECSLRYDNSMFTPAEWPERSLEAYAAGQLGVVVPELDHFYLFIAYRRLAGKAITPADVDRLRTFDPCWKDGSEGYFGKYWPSAPLMQAVQGEWRKAREQSGLPPAPVRPRNSQSVLGYIEHAVPNCNPDAFRNAARTLAARIATHGNDAWTRNWVDGQDAVFFQCFATGGEPPRPAPADAPAWLKADRAYQQAAAQFYAGQYGDAAQRFLAIAADANSPWQPWGRYLAARALLRQASQKERGGDEYLAAAQTLLQQALTDGKDSVLREDIARMLQRVRLRTEPAQVFAEIDARLTAPALGPGVGQDVRDFQPHDAPAADFDLRDPGFAAWLQVLRGKQVPDDVPAQAPSEAALVALLQVATPGMPRLDALLQQAAAVRPASPAWQTVQFHRIRLLPNRAEASRLAHQVLALPETQLANADRNRFKALALPLARTQDEFAQLAVRTLVQASDLPPRQKEIHVPVLDADGGAIVNRALPLDRLHALHVSARTPAPLREELLGPVWTRALVLSRWDVLHAMRPEMEQRFAADAALLRRLDEAPPEERAPRAALFLLRHPELLGSVSTELAWLPKASEFAQPNMHRQLREEGSRANWWCSLPSGRWWRDDKPPEPPPLPTFLSARDKARWQAEYATLTATPDATEFLGRLALDWAKQHPRDATLPDALRMVVRSARGGCVTPVAVGYGRQAFRHLHRYFPDSEAARSTRSHG